MARIRTIKPEFFTSEDITELDPLARLLYIALWCEADKEGRFAWKPKTFKIRYLPVDSCDIDAIADALITRGLVVLYGDGLAYIPSFKTHQHINPREKASTLPDPEITKNNDASSRVNAPSVTCREEGRKERKDKDASLRSSTLFENFWQAYPKKVGKDAAKKAFEKRKPDESMASQMIDAIGKQAASEQWRKDGGAFIPHPATWLNQGRWMDGEGQAPTLPFVGMI